MCLAGDFPAGQHLRCGTPPPGPTPHSIDRVLPHSPWAVPDGRPDGEDGRRSLGALLRNTREQCTNLSLPVAPVSPQRADRGQFASLRPACDGLGVDAKHRGDLRGRQQRLCLWCTCGHVRGLSSWTSGAILRFLCCLVLRGERVGDVQIWPDRDHIAITSGDASTTRRKVSVPGCPVTPPITVTQGRSSDTYRRIAPDSEITVRRLSAGGPRVLCWLREGRPPRTPPMLSWLRWGRPSRTPPILSWLRGGQPPEPPRYSVGLLEFSECTPSVAGAHIHGDGEFTLASGRAVDGGADLGHRL